nr:hypothetical protein [uncultured Pseudomonas sp.]
MKHGLFYFNTLSLVSSVLTISSYFIPNGASGVQAWLSRDVPLWMLFLALTVTSIILSLVFLLNRKGEKYERQQLLAEKDGLIRERDQLAADCQLAKERLLKYQGQEDLVERLKDYTQLENLVLSHLKGGLSKTGDDLARLTGRDVGEVMLALHALGDRIVGRVGYYQLA